MPKNVTNIKQGCYLYTQSESFKLVSGLELNSLELAYETYGELNTNKDNVILIHHSLSMSAHAANLAQNTSSEFDYNHDSSAGWWDNTIGPGKSLDTNKYYIICINNLGSCFGSTGPTSYDDFPDITMHDMVNSQKLLLEYLGINKVKLIIGSSMGGMLSLAWLQLYPDNLENLFVAACAHKAYPINIFNRMIQQEIISLSGSNKSAGLKLARMLGFYNYRSSNELNSRFCSDNKNFIIDQNLKNNHFYKSTELYSYFSYNADKFVKNFDYKSYVCLLNAMDLLDLSIEKPYHKAGFNNINPDVKIIITGIDSDILFPIWQQKETYELLAKFNYKPKFIEHKSKYGHDSFLIEYKQFGQYISELLI